MSNVRIELNNDGVRELLQSPEIQETCQEYATAAANRAGSGYSTSAYMGKTRVNVSVYAATEKAVKDNRKNNTIIKAVWG